MIILPDRVRIGARHGPADRHCALRHRHRHRDRADGAHRRRHARLHHRGGGDGRPRCRHRLRAVHRHQIPREPRGRARSRAQRHPRHRHRRPRGAVRGHDRRDLGARSAAHEDVDHARRRHRHLDRRAHHDAGVGHPAARAARLRRPQHRQVRAPAPQAPRGRHQGVGLDALEPRHPAAPVAGGHHRPGWCCCCSPCRCCRCASASPTPATDRPADTTRRAYDLVAEGFGAGFNGPLLLAAETPNGEADLATLERAQRQAQRHQGGRVRHPAAGQRRRHGRGDAGVPHHRPAGRGHRRPREPPARRRRPVGHRGHRST